MFNISTFVLPYHVLTVSIATDGRIYVVYDLKIINMQVQPKYILDFYMLFRLPYARCETETTVISCLLLSHADCNTSSTAQGGGGSFKNRKPIGEVGCCESGMAERIH